MSNNCKVGKYTSKDACTDHATAVQGLAVCKDELETCESDKDTLYALTLTFGILMVILLVLVSVLVPLAKKGKI